MGQNILHGLITTDSILQECQVGNWSYWSSNNLVTLSVSTIVLLKAI